MPNCEAPNCNQEFNHIGPHGHSMGGFTLAPYSEDSRKSTQDIEEPILCNSCGKPLTLHPTAARATCICGQSISLTANGKSSQTILPKLYPEKITDSKMMLESGEYKISQFEFFDRLSLAFGFITQSEYEERQINSQKLLENFIKEHVQPLEKKPSWLKRLLKIK